MMCRQISFHTVTAMSSRGGGGGGGGARQRLARGARLLVQ